MSTEPQPRHPPRGDPPQPPVHVEDGTVWIWRAEESRWREMRQDLPGSSPGGDGTSSGPPPDLWKVASPTAAIAHRRDR